jgi:pimeloyl-ACP methyl ester carboxylesterase
MTSSTRTIVNIAGDPVFVRHSTLRPGQPTLLFLHGLGDSSLAFDEAFSRNECRDFGVVAPDLPGHGRSAPMRNGRYTLEDLASHLAALIEAMDLRRLTVVGHSLSGDIATVLLSRDQSGRIERIVNLEGNLTPADLFISSRAAEAAAGGLEAFEAWFREQFREETVFQGWAGEGEAGRRYYASLRFCEPGAFLACATDLYARNRHADARGLSGIGSLYASLPMPKRFIYGTRSLSAASVKLIAELGIESHAIPAGHWVMIDAAPEFYRLVRRFIVA